MSRSVIRTLIREAAQSKHKQHRMSAALVKGSNILSIGHNYGPVHAEEACLRQAGPKAIAGSSLVVIRLRKNGGLGEACPCPNCAALLHSVNIKYVAYSRSDGGFTEDCVEDLTRRYSFISLGFKSSLWNKG